MLSIPQQMVYHLGVKTLLTLSQICYKITQKICTAENRVHARNGDMLHDSSKVSVCAKIYLYLDYILKLWIVNIVLFLCNKYVSLNSNKFWRTVYNNDLTLPKRVIAGLTAKKDFKTNNALFQFEIRRL